MPSHFPLIYNREYFSVIQAVEHTSCSPYTLIGADIVTVYGLDIFQTDLFGDVRILQQMNADVTSWYCTSGTNAVGRKDFAVELSTSGWEEMKHCTD